MIDPQTKFTRVLKGYSPQEVDAVFDEFQRQLDAYKSQINNLKTTIEQYDFKIRQLADSTERLEQERIKENLRITELFNEISEMAEQMKEKARRRAEDIIAKARREAGLIQTEPEFARKPVRSSAVNSTAPERKVPIRVRGERRRGSQLR